MNVGTTKKVFLYLRTIFVHKNRGLFKKQLII